MLIEYKRLNIGAKRLAVIETANVIITEYEAQGFILTLRQLYYQFVARGLLANTQQNYKNLGDTLNDGRLAGLISWESMEDRTRNLVSLSHWESPRQIVEACARQFRVDLWEDQPRRVEVWVEKDALVGVIEKVCQKNDVPFFACRGNTSQSELWRAGRRLMEYAEAGQEPLIIHAGDLDPNGWDMTRDNRDRLSLFAERPIELRRIALNMEQVDHYRPPVNPVKLTDSRATSYIEQFGYSCWELDALEPRVIAKLIQDAIDDVRDPELWDEALARQQDGRERLDAIVESLGEDAGA